MDCKNSNAVQNDVSQCGKLKNNLYFRNLESSEKHFFSTREHTILIKLLPGFDADANIVSVAVAIVWSKLALAVALLNVIFRQSQTAIMSFLQDFNKLLKRRFSSLLIGITISSIAIICLIKLSKVSCLQTSNLADMQESILIRACPRPKLTNNNFQFNPRTNIDKTQSILSSCRPDGIQSEGNLAGYVSYWSCSS